MYADFATSIAAYGPHGQGSERDNSVPKSRHSQKSAKNHGIIPNNKIQYSLPLPPPPPPPPLPPPLLPPPLPQQQHHHQHQQEQQQQQQQSQQQKQPAVWTWLNSLGVDNARMVSPSYPCSPPAQVHAGVASDTSRARPPLRRRPTAAIPTASGTKDFPIPKMTTNLSHVPAAQSRAQGGARLALDSIAHQTSTSGVLFGVSELLGPRPSQLNHTSHKRKIMQPPQLCLKCYTSDTPEWRNGPAGVGTLCNVCGLVFAKKRARRDRGPFGS